MVHGGAGSGKSKVIHSLYTMMSSIFKQPGDDPCCPYVVLSSFTGAASANIGGQTLHSLFGFKFGNSFLSMTEKQRAEKRNLFRNLRCIIVDEISMVSADLFYNLDLRLREITMVDDIMGGLSVFIFGDLFQLQPPKARYVFEEPKNKEHAMVFRLRNLWRQFRIVHLEENHRQGEDKQYGDLLNRVRVGLHTEEDIDLLRSRVVPQNDPALNDSIHIYGTNAKVNSRNNAKLKEIPGALIEIKAQNQSRTIKKFSRNNSGCIMNTPFQAVLKLKINAEVVLVHNICTLDGLTNGARGVLVAIEKDGNTVKRMLVKFHNPEHGKGQREKNPSYRYPDATYIDPVLWPYFIGGATATVFQFPLKGAAAITSHKIQVQRRIKRLNLSDIYLGQIILEHISDSCNFQGQTVSKPNSLVIDVASSHQAGMVYVMLSRCCSLQQLSIIDDFDPDKIKVNEKVLEEAKRMWKKCLNRNPEHWMDLKVKGLRVSSLNVRSLCKHVEDVRSDPYLMQADLLGLQESWLTPDDERQERYELDGYNSFFLSQGRGKGLVVYVRGGLRVEDARHHNGTHLQMMKICLLDLDVIFIYRSSDEPFSSVVHYLKDLLNNTKTTLLIGDINYCFTQQNPLSRYHNLKLSMSVTFPPPTDSLLKKSLTSSSPAQLTSKEVSHCISVLI